MLLPHRGKLFDALVIPIELLSYMQLCTLYVYLNAFSCCGHFTFMHLFYVFPWILLKCLLHILLIYLLLYFHLFSQYILCSSLMMELFLKILHLLMEQFTANSWEKLLRRLKTESLIWLRTSTICWLQQDLLCVVRFCLRWSVPSLYNLWADFQCCSDIYCNKVYLPSVIKHRKGYLPNSV